MLSESCGTCKFWFMAGDGSYGYCRVRAPSGGDLPKPSPGWWCGEWEASGDAMAAAPPQITIEWFAIDDLPRWLNGPIGEAGPRILVSDRESIETVIASRVVSEGADGKQHLRTVLTGVDGQPPKCEHARMWAPMPRIGFRL